MSTISSHDVAHLAGLTRLRHDAAHDALYAERLSAAVDLVGQLESVSVQAEHQRSLANVTMADLPRPEGHPLSHLREALLAGAPRRDGSHIAVQAVFSTEGGES